MMVQDFLRKSAQVYPDKIALEFSQEQWTYGRLETTSTRLASSMLDLGIARNDRAVIFLRNSCEVVLSIFACLKIRAIFIVLNVQIPERKLSYILEDSGAVLVITDENNLGKTQNALSFSHKVGNILVCGAADDEGRHDDQRIANTSPRLSHFGNACVAGTDVPPRYNRAGTSIDLASIIYTSGSTGVPKGVMSTHLNIVSAVESINTYLKNTADDIVFNVLPFSFDYGLYQIFLMFACGGKLVIDDKFGYPYSLLEKLDTFHITALPLVPTIASSLARLSPSECPAFPALRYVTNTGEVLPTANIRHLRKMFPTAQLYSMYGLTECKRVSYLPPSEIDKRPDSVGIPMPNCEVSIVDDDDQPVACGQVGELVVRGPHVMQGYWDSPEETRRVFRKGACRVDARLYTGDLFRMDRDGFLYFVSRKDDLLKIHGERVSPKEIENVLHEIEDVAEAAIVVAKDRNDQKYIFAMIVAVLGKVIPVNEIMNYCSERLEPHLVPRKVKFLKSLPKNENGKIDRAVLCKM